MAVGAGRGEHAPSTCHGITRRQVSGWEGTKQHIQSLLQASLWPPGDHCAGMASSPRVPASKQGLATGLPSGTPTSGLQSLRQWSSSSVRLGAHLLPSSPQRISCVPPQGHPLVSRLQVTSPWNGYNKPSKSIRKLFSLLRKQLEIPSYDDAVQNKYRLHLYFVAAGRGIFANLLHPSLLQTPESGHPPPFKVLRSLPVILSVGSVITQCFTGADSVLMRLAWIGPVVF